MTEQSFEKLTTWQKAHQLMLDVHLFLRSSYFPQGERHGIH